MHSAPDTELLATTPSTFEQLEQQSQFHLNVGNHESSGWFEQHGGWVLTAKEDDHPREQTEVLLRFAQWYFKDGRYTEGLAFAIKAVEVARTAGLLALHRRSLNLLGLLYSRTGYSAKATVCYVEGLQLADRIGDRMGRAAVLANLAELRYNAGLIAESITLNRYVIDLTANEPQFVQLLADAHHNIAAASLLLHDIETATAEITEAIRLALDPTNHFLAHQHVILQATYSRVLLENRRLAEARQSARQAEKLATAVNSRPALVQASLAQALCDAAEGKAKLAFDRLHSTRDQIAHDEPLYRDFLEIEVLCNSYAGKKQDAAKFRSRHLSSLAQFQRRSLIRQVAAFQRSVRTLGATPESDLLALPSDARKKLIKSWAVAEKDELLREQLEALASLADHREDDGAEHSLRVGRLVQLTARKIGYSERDSNALGLAARLHDIGKLATPDALLLKRGTLASVEIEIVRRHTIEGSQILTDILATIEHGSIRTPHLDSLRVAAEVALHHHEWWDGSGYPRQLRGPSIPESARITALADVFDELITSRPYRASLSVSDAIHQMASLSNKQFDPSLFPIFAELVADLSVRYGLALTGLSAGDADLSPYQKANRVIERIIESSRAGEKSQDQSFARN